MAQNADKMARVHRIADHSKEKEANIGKICLCLSISVCTFIFLMFIVFSYWGQGILIADESTAQDDKDSFVVVMRLTYCILLPIIICMILCSLIYFLPDTKDKSNRCSKICFAVSLSISTLIFVTLTGFLINDMIGNKSGVNDDVVRSLAWVGMGAIAGAVFLVVIALFVFKACKQWVVFQNNVQNMSTNDVTTATAI